MGAGILPIMSYVYYGITEKLVVVSYILTIVQKELLISIYYE